MGEMGGYGAPPYESRNVGPVTVPAWFSPESKHVFDNRYKAIL